VVFFLPRALPFLDWRLEFCFLIKLKLVRMTLLRRCAPGEDCGGPFVFRVLFFRRRSTCRTISRDLSRSNLNLFFARWPSRVYLRVHTTLLFCEIDILWLSTPLRLIFKRLNFQHFANI
jgi:hypothetical protein